jgi:hypothetical protein
MDWPQTVILPISASQVTRITDQCYDFIETEFGMGMRKVTTTMPLEEIFSQN